MISVNQTVEAPSGERLDLEAEQGFFVDAPQFSLPEGSVHSTYPPAGYNDDNRILPHIVFTDPHLPWERLGSPKMGTNKELRMRMRMLAEGKATGDPVRNRVPWLVILSFSQDELRLPPEDLDGTSSIFRNTSATVIKPVKQSATMTVNMSIADLWKLTPNVATPVTQDLGPETMKDSRGDFIFVPSTLFTSLFSAYDTNGDRIPSAGPDTTQFQFLSHVRKINGSGMALAGVEDTAVFSIVVGNRSGPLDNALPTTMCVHLTSIEGVESMSLPNASQGTKYVALCSLYSWNYTVLPPNALNVPDAFEQLGRTLNVLRAPDRIIDPLQASNEKIKQLVARRLRDGYTLVKYRAQTGEATVALYRGPLTPTHVSSLEYLTACSNSGSDLQIMDKQLGIMDLTYLIAWQVGRTMALGDQSFTAALGRLRSSIHTVAAASAKLQIVKEVDETAFRTRKNVLTDIRDIAKNLATIHLNPRGSRDQSNHVFAPGGAKRRWFRPRLGRKDRPNMRFGSSRVQNKYPDAALKAARAIARSTSGDIFDETNDPQSTDWMTVLSWLVDRMFLAGVPAHCLIPDSTFLEPESLRFFHIDRNWVDALIDGALSLGNHWGIDEDRVAIKKALNDYINHVPEGQTSPVQIPSYGFFLRSDLVTMFPDLRVEVLADEDALRRADQGLPSGAPLLRHEIVTDGVMMAFMDRVPGSAMFSSLVLTQPAHQQRFAVARGLDTQEIKIDIRRQYTVDQATRETDKNRHDRLEQRVYTPSGETSLDNVFLWDSSRRQRLNDLRILRLPRFAQVQLDSLKNGMGRYDDAGVSKPYFSDDAPTSALFGMQLNDPIYNLTIDLKDHSPTSMNISGLHPPADGNGSSEIRTLTLMKAARSKGMASRGEADDEYDPARTRSKLLADDENGTATFRRLENYTANAVALSRNLAPHVRCLSTSYAPAIDLDIVHPVPTRAFSYNVLDTGDTDQGSEPAMAPRYHIRIGSNIVHEWSIIKLGTPNLAQDLIFSVVLEQSNVSQYLLMEVNVQIELGEPATTANDTKRFLMQNYTGSGAHMLTNLRFNVLASTFVDRNNRQFLLLRLLPRAAKGWVRVTTQRELSFLLALATINAPKKYKEEIYVQSSAKYCRNPDLPLDDRNTQTISNPDILVTIINTAYPS
ncbi:hypothetical protein HIM_09690 [Hirsutella minnesotensis 3608]|uniref:Uncharacterized protein n=1 Tax=Hirsutella minnesotensis 3608 TaxID=1043627 RepID=A0A0F8A2Z5_9HYPO|nr:hypothetical protein HIM_09690 [Hirsutella minnesotensis 3608]